MDRKKVKVGAFILGAIAGIVKLGLDWTERSQERTEIEELRHEVLDMRNEMNAIDTTAEEIEIEE